MDKEAKRHTGVIVDRLRRNWPDKKSDLWIGRLAERMFEFLMPASEGGDSALAVFLKGREGTSNEQRLLGVFEEVISRGGLRFSKVFSETLGVETTVVAEFEAVEADLPRDCDCLSVMVSPRMFSIVGRIGETEREVPYLNLMVLSADGLTRAEDFLESIDNSFCVGSREVSYHRNEVGEVVSVLDRIGTTSKKDDKERRGFQSVYRKVGEVSLGDGGWIDGVVGLNKVNYVVFLQRES